MTTGGDLVAPARSAVAPTRTVKAGALFLVGTRLATDLEGVSLSNPGAERGGVVEWSGAGDDPDPDPDPGWRTMLDFGCDESGGCGGWRGQGRLGFWKTEMGPFRLVAVAAISPGWLGGGGLSPGGEGRPDSGGRLVLGVGEWSFPIARGGGMVARKGGARPWRLFGYGG